MRAHIDGNMQFNLQQGLGVITKLFVERTATFHSRWRCCYLVSV